NCGSDCSEVYDSGQKVTLSASPDQDSVFAGWSGDLIGVDNPMTITMDSEKTVTAKFVPAGATFTLTVIKSGPGHGTVTSEDGQIDCGEICTTTYPAGTVVTLTASPDENSGFDSWTGDVNGSDNSISFIMDEDKTAIAVFGPTPLPDLTGEWQNLKISGFMGRSNILTGFLLLKNIGEAAASGGYKISFYLSANGTSLDTLVTTRTIDFDLAAKSSRKISFVYYLRTTVPLTGKYLIAYLDSDNILEEKDEANNLVVFGRINETTAVSREDESGAVKKGSTRLIIK
ncbi:MAG: InlB B-repeat-containing protein, partial [Candidatus Saccharicenans sp.]